MPTFSFSKIDRMPLLRFDVPMNDINGSGAMFDGIAQNYDLLNRVTSMGFDRIWRKKAVSSLNLSSGDCLLDLAAGTLDVSIEANKQYPGVKILSADPSKGMLRMGRGKLAASAVNTLIIAEGENLPIRNAGLDGAIIAFGIRNFANRQTALQALAGALKPRARLVILELSIPKRGITAPFARFYVHRIIPILGTLLSSSAEYKYLPQSMQRFPQPEQFEQELMSNGFSMLRTESFMFQTCHLFVCEKQ